MIKWTDNVLSAGFDALMATAAGFFDCDVYLYGANLEVDRGVYDPSYYAPLSPSQGTWLARPDLWPTAHVGPGRWSKGSPVFEWTPRVDTTVFGWLVYSGNTFGILFAEKLWPGGQILKAGELFKFQITIVLSDGCPSCVC